MVLNGGGREISLVIHHVQTVADQHAPMVSDLCTNKEDLLCAMTIHAQCVKMAVSHNHQSDLEVKVIEEMVAVGVVRAFLIMRIKAGVVEEAEVMVVKEIFHTALGVDIVKIRITKTGKVKDVEEMKMEIEVKDGGEIAVIHGTRGVKEIAEKEDTNHHALMAVVLHVMMAAILYTVEGDLLVVLMIHNLRVMMEQHQKEETHARVKAGLRVQMAAPLSDLQADEALPLALMNPSPPALMEMHHKDQEG